MKICKTYDEDIFCKFKKDEDGSFFNEKLRNEAIRRTEFSKSRSENRKKTKINTFKNEDMINICLTCVNHMETETETETINLICHTCFNKSKFKKNMNNIFSYEESVKIMLSEDETNWRQKIMMSSNIKSENKLIEIIKLFMLKQNGMSGYFPKKIDDTKNHFFHWLLKQAEERTGNNQSDVLESKMKVY